MNKNQQLNSLIELNDELENYFRNTIIPQLFVDADLVLRKFTPPAMKQFKLAETDIGKSISDVKENFRFPTFVENIQQVIDTGAIGKRNTDYGYALVPDERTALQSI
jgi:two-component system phosphate regulon sensor histidine kinase PhoR